MAQSCIQCGSICRDDLKICAFCDSPLTGERFASVSERIAPHPRLRSVCANATQNQTAEAPEWHEEMTRKVDAYRRRRGNDASATENRDLQPDLPFLPAGHATAGSGTRGADLVPAYAVAVHHPQRERVATKGQDHRVEISISQPDLNFSGPEHKLAAYGIAADTADRVQAGMIDLCFLAIVCGGFLLFFRTLGGRMDLTRTDAGIFAASFFLLYMCYFSLFMILGGATPGMLICGLTVLRVDGDALDTPCLAWRSIGYVLSGGTLFLGFLWAIWDEERLTWHDRISQTFISAAEVKEDTVEQRVAGRRQPEFRKLPEGRTATMPGSGQ